MNIKNIELNNKKKHKIENIFCVLVSVLFSIICVLMCLWNNVGHLLFLPFIFLLILFSIIVCYENYRLDGAKFGKWYIEKVFGIITIFYIWLNHDCCARLNYEKISYVTDLMYLIFSVGTYIISKCMLIWLINITFMIFPNLIIYSISVYWAKICSITHLILIKLNNITNDLFFACAYFGILKHEKLNYYILSTIALVALYYAWVFWAKYDDSFDEKVVNNHFNITYAITFIFLNVLTLLLGDDNNYFAININVFLSMYAIKEINLKNTVKNKESSIKQEDDKAKGKDNNELKDNMKIITFRNECCFCIYNKRKVCQKCPVKIKKRICKN